MEVDSDSEVEAMSADSTTGPRTQGPTNPFVSKDIVQSWLKPACNMSVRCNLFQTCKLFHEVMGQGMPRQGKLWARNAAVGRSCAPVPRLSSRPPIVEEYQAPSRVRQDAESEIHVELIACSMQRAQEVTKRVAVLADKMQLKNIPHTQVFHLHSSGVGDECPREVLRGLPPLVRDNVHTLCVRRRTVTLPRLGALFPYIRISYPRVSVVDLHKMGADLQMVGVVFPHLRSLRLSCASHITNWPSLTAMTGLQELKLRMFDPEENAENMQFALDAVSQTSWLTSLSLLDFGWDVVDALSQCTQLTSLCLSSDQISAVQAPLFQAGLDAFARQCPGLLRLHLALRYNIVMPAVWTHLEDVYVRHKMVVPPLDSISTLEIGRTQPFPGEQLVFTRYCALRPLPRNIKSLRIGFNALPAALDCHYLVHLAWTPVWRDGGFTTDDYLQLMAYVSREVRVWPLLETVLILDDRPGQAHCPSEIERETRDLYNSQMLLVLASRRTPCVIQHLTVQGEHWMFLAGAFEAVCSMPLIRSVTLIGTSIPPEKIRKLRTLVKVGTMRLLELIGVTGVDEDMAKELQRASNGVCRVHRMAMAEVDTESNGDLDWEM